MKPALGTPKTASPRKKKKASVGRSKWASPLDMGSPSTSSPIQARINEDSMSELNKKRNENVNDRTANTDQRSSSSKTTSKKKSDTKQNSKLSKKVSSESEELSETLTSSSQTTTDIMKRPQHAKVSEPSANGNSIPPPPPSTSPSPATLRKDLLQKVSSHRSGTSWTTAEDKDWPSPLQSEEGRKGSPGTFTPTQTTGRKEPQSSPIEDGAQFAVLSSIDDKQRISLSPGGNKRRSSLQKSQKSLSSPGQMKSPTSQKMVVKPQSPKISTPKQMEQTTSENHTSKFKEISPSSTHFDEDNPQQPPSSPSAPPDEVEERQELVDYVRRSSVVSTTSTISSKSYFNPRHGTSPSPRRRSSANRRISSIHFPTSPRPPILSEDDDENDHQRIKSHGESKEMSTFVQSPSQRSKRFSAGGGGKSPTKMQNSSRVMDGDSMLSPAARRSSFKSQNHQSPEQPRRRSSRSIASSTGSNKSKSPRPKFSPVQRVPKQAKGEKKMLIPVVPMGDAWEDGSQSLQPLSRGGDDSTSWEVPMKGPGSKKKRSSDEDDEDAVDMELLHDLNMASFQSDVTIPTLSSEGNMRKDQDLLDNSLAFDSNSDEEEENLNGESLYEGVDYDDDGDDDAIARMSPRKKKCDGGGGSPHSYEGVDYDDGDDAQDAQDIQDRDYLIESERSNLYASGLDAIPEDDSDASSGESSSHAGSSHGRPKEARESIELESLMQQKSRSPQIDLPLLSKDKNEFDPEMSLSLSDLMVNSPMEMRKKRKEQARQAAAEVDTSTSSSEEESSMPSSSSSGEAEEESYSSSSDGSSAATDTSLKAKKVMPVVIPETDLSDSDATSSDEDNDIEAQRRVRVVPRSSTSEKNRDRAATNRDWKDSLIDVMQSETTKHAAFVVLAVFLMFDIILLGLFLARR